MNILQNGALLIFITKEYLTRSWAKVTIVALKWHQMGWAKVSNVNFRKL